MTRVIRVPKDIRVTVGGWGSTVGTTECRTADISEFRNFANSKIRKVELFYFSIYFLFLRFF